MRHFPHLLPPDLPPPLRVVSLLGLLFLLAALPLFLGVFIPILPSFPQSPADARRVSVIGMNLVILSAACTSAVGNYRMRVRQPDRRPFPLSSWQSRMWASALVAALSICSLVLAVVIPPTSRAFVVVYPVSLLALAVFFATIAATIAVTTGQQGGD